MAEFGTFTFGSGVVYGASSEIVSVTPIAQNVIRVTLTDDILVNSAYYDPSNYLIQIVDPEAPPLDDPTGAYLTVKSVLPTNGVSVTKEIVLVTYSQSRGTLYQFNIVASALLARNGASVVGYARWTSRATKLDAMLSNLPSHFSRDPKSNIYSLLAAIASSDDAIGGARNDVV